MSSEDREREIVRLRIAIARARMAQPRPASPLGRFQPLLVSGAPMALLSPRSRRRARRVVGIVRIVLQLLAIAAPFLLKWLYARKEARQLEDAEQDLEDAEDDEEYEERDEAS